MLKDRILELLKRNQLSASDFAKIIGVNASAISHLISGRRESLSIDSVVKIVNKFPEVSLDWLILGKGEPDETKREAFQGNLFSANDVRTTKTQQRKEQASEVFMPQRNAQRDASKNAAYPGSAKVKLVLILFEDGSFQELEP